MVNTGLLVLSNPAKVRKLLPIVREHVFKTLYVQYFPEKNGLLGGNYSASTSRWKSAPFYAQTVNNIYEIASSCSTMSLDVRVLLTVIKNSTMSVINTKRPIELVIFDQAYAKNDANTFIQDCLANTSMGCKYMIVDDEKTQDDPGESFQSRDTENADFQMYNNVVLGGTFDRLHGGHKMLLSEALLSCKKNLTIGVTDKNMLMGKVLWELIEPYDERIRQLKDFLEDVDSSTNYNLVPLLDIYGPTKDDPSFELIVVSEETLRGATKINEARLQNGFNKLDVHIIKLVEESNASENEENKISSSNKRMRLLGTRLKKPHRMEDRNKRPYIIGLTGSIASGKSSVAQKLQSLGAALVNCDKIAHDLYEPGERCYRLIVEMFGKGILTEDGRIDRKALGNIVFSDKKQLDKLNNAVWPAILDETKKQIDQLYSQGSEIIIMEAAVLIQAKWQYVCHEIWTCIIPPKEAVKRVVERNAMTEEEALSRIQVQPSNLEQVAEATVVFSTLWSHEFTLQQVQRAWNSLKLFLEETDPKSRS